MSVGKVTVTRRPLGKIALGALRELFGLESLPFAPSLVEIELRDVPVAVVNALRRCAMEEMPGRALVVPEGGFDALVENVDVFMLPAFVNQRISLLALRPQIPGADALEFRLDVSNPGAEPKHFYAGDLEQVAGPNVGPIFNPTTKLGFLQPGKRVLITGIRVSTGYGRDHAIYNVARRGAYTHLDIPQHEGVGHPDSPYADESGYKVSCLVANPRHHLLRLTLPATVDDPAEARATIADACEVLAQRFRLVISIAEAGAGAGRHGAQYSVVAHEGGLEEGVLFMPGETFSVAEALRRAVFDLTPGISNVNYVINAGQLRFTIRHTEDVTRILTTAARHLVSTFEALYRGIAGRK